MTLCLSSYDCDLGLGWWYQVFVEATVVQCSSEARRLLDVHTSGQVALSEQVAIVIDDAKCITTWLDLS